MNQSQFLGIIRAVVAPALTYAVGKGWLTTSMVADFTAVSVTLATALWTYFVHTDQNKVAEVTALSPADQHAAFNSIPDGAKIAAVEALPDVRRIVVAPDARDGVATAAADPSRPKVVK